MHARSKVTCMRPLLTRSFSCLLSVSPGAGCLLFLSASVQALLSHECWLVVKSCEKYTIGFCMLPWQTRCYQIMFVTHVSGQEYVFLWSQILNKYLNSLYPTFFTILGWSCKILTKRHSTWNDLVSSSHFRPATERWVDIGQKFRKYSYF